MLSKSSVKIDLSRDSLFDEMGMRRLKDSYMLKTEKSPQERFSFSARAFASNKEHAQRLYDYSSKHWLSNSTPILSFGTNKRAQPISCFLSYIADSAEGLVDAMSEVAWLSMSGGGVGIGVGIRSEDAKSVGVMPHLKVYEAVSLAYRQGKTRRGSFAPYLNIDHPNIVQFIEMRKPTGDQNQRVMELHHGINISDKFMQLIERCMLDANVDDSWPLFDPHSGETKSVVSARNLWENILETRMRTGEPYIHFVDRSNECLPDFQKSLGLKIVQSNICTEITLATDALRTAVCCISSVNATYWDEFKNDYQFFRDVAEMLDNALEYFIKKAPKSVKRAVYSAMRERSIGVGVLGFHAYLQSKGVPFESAMAVSLNKSIFKTMKKFLDRANYELAEERGPCLDYVEGKGKGRPVRFAHTMAVAPNASSSILMGNTSPSIEPFRANAYRQDTLSGSFLNKNPYLDAILKERLTGKDYDKAWQQVVSAAGSCQMLDCLTDDEKNVFKTATELDQLWVIQHAADRQPEIDQSQSVNVFFKANVTILELHNVHFQAWKKKLKTLYYCRSDKVYHGESMNKKVERVKLAQDMSIESQCIACE